MIPTRNRPEHVEVLLKSIVAAQPTNTEIIVIASGIDISSVIDKYKKELHIKYRHSDISGQINQKLLALSMIHTNTSWVMFCDDDLIFSKDFFINFAKVVPSDEHIIGLGISLPSTEKLKNPSRIATLFSKIFFLHNSEEGALLRNGHACSYMKAQYPIKTQWLSGASIWRKDFALEYSSVYSNTKYAAYEDVIYSHRMSKFGTLIYMPSLRLDFQEIPTNDVEPLDAFISAMFWRNYLINSDEYFSKSLFLWSQVGRNIEFITRTHGCATLKLSISFIELIYANIFKKDSTVLLGKYC